MLCAKCHKEVDKASVILTNDYSQITFHYHPKCWVIVWSEAAKMYILAIYKARQRQKLLKGM